jgi:hypothetical protein
MSGGAKLKQLLTNGGYVSSRSNTGTTAARVQSLARNSGISDELAAKQAKGSLFSRTKLMMEQSSANASAPPKAPERKDGSFGNRAASNTFEAKTGKFGAIQKFQKTPAANTLLATANKTVYGGNRRGGTGPPGLSGGGTLLLVEGHTALDRARQVAMAKGGLKKRDPNNLATVTKAKEVTNATGGGGPLGSLSGAINCSGTGPVRLIRTKTNPNARGGFQGTKAARAKGLFDMQRGKGKQRVSLAEALGKAPIDMESDEAKKLLNAKSVNAPMLRADKEDEAIRRLDHIIEVEKMESKLDDVKQRKVNAFKCDECDQIYRKKEDFCLKKGHHVRKVKAIVRFFNCNHCKWRLETIGEHFPKRPCQKCKNPASYTRVSALRKKTAAPNTGPKLWMGRGGVV